MIRGINSFKTENIIEEAAKKAAKELVEKGNYPEEPTSITIKLPKPHKGRDVL